MTDDMMSLRSLLEKTPDADLLREMIGFAAERLMELEVGNATGTGYGEKSAERLAQRNGYLQQLPAHVVKIDRSFVFGLEDGEREQSLVRSMIAMSHGMGYSVVGEGVETAAAADLLAEMGCEEAQGYFFAKPMEAVEFVAWTRTHQPRGSQKFAA